MNAESPDRRTQNLRDRLNPLEYYSEREFRDFYRFNKHNFLLIAADLRPIIARAANHAGLNVVQQLALASGFIPLVNSRIVQVSPCTLP